MRRIASTPFTASLRSRMTIGFTASFAVFSLLACVGFYLWARYTARKDAAERTAAAASLVAQEWNGSPDSWSVSRAFAEAREDARLDSVALVLLDNQGRVLGNSGHPPLDWPAPESRGWLVSRMRVGEATAIAGVAWTATEQTLLKQTLLVFLLTLLATGMAASGAWVLVGKTLAPIGALSDQAKSASADPLLARLAPPSEDAEVRRLVDTLNDFLERLRDTTIAREQFYAAAAHELRTPLAVLSGSVEVALSRPRDAAEYRETLTDLEHQVKRLTTLVEDLLTLNRLDMHRGAEEQEQESVDLVDLSTRTLQALAPTITERDLQITTQFASISEVLAPPSHVGILIRNLIENAVKYATPGGSVSVSTRALEAGLVELRVYNDHSSPVPLDLARWCEPFYRADPSRSAMTGGNGLGLAICQRIADINTWVFCIQSESGGIGVTVLFP